MISAHSSKQMLFMIVNDDVNVDMDKDLKVNVNVDEIEERSASHSSVGGLIRIAPALSRLLFRMVLFSSFSSAWLVQWRDNPGIKIRYASQYGAINDHGQ